MGETILDSLAEGRSCGDCTICCETLKITVPELLKPAGVLCEHCTGGGCSIYETRPQVCREWYCLWRRLGQMPDVLRPDRLGVVFYVRHKPEAENLFERFFILARAARDEAALNHPLAQQAIAMFVREGSMPVWTGFKHSLKLVYPDAQFGDAILNPETTAWKALVPRAVEWRKRYGMG